MRTIFANALALGLGVGLLASAADLSANDGRRGADYRRDGGYSAQDRGRAAPYRDSGRFAERGRHDRRAGERAKHWGGHDRYDDHRYGYSHRDHDRHGIWPGYRGSDPWRYRAPARYLPPRGYVSYRWSRGHRLPPAYYTRPYYIDYRSYSLAPPPYGHRWVRVDNDVLLVALATGLIGHAIHDLFYY